MCSALQRVKPGLQDFVIIALTPIYATVQRVSAQPGSVVASSLALAPINISARNCSQKASQKRELETLAKRQVPSIGINRGRLEINRKGQKPFVQH